VDTIIVAWLVYLIADTFVTPKFRIPIPPLLAVFAVVLVANRAVGRVWSLFRPPRWSYPLFAIFAFSMIHDPGANTLFMLVFVTTIALFRSFAVDARSFVRLCRTFYVVLVASSGLLFLSYAVPAFGLGLRVVLFGEGALERPYPAGLSQLVHVYGYQVAALCGVTIALLARDLLAWPVPALRVAALTVHASMTVLLGMQRSAILGIAAAAAVIITHLRVRRLVYWGTIFTLVAALVILLFPASELLDATVIGKDRQDTSKSMRWALQTETIEIILEHPWGLILEQREWGPDLFKWGGALSGTGLSGHNAYLMTLAYLGLPALILIGLVLWNGISAVISSGFGRLDGPGGPWPAAMVAAMIATMINALFHNASLFSAEGSTIFAYVAVCHWRDLVLDGRINP